MGYHKIWTTLIVQSAFALAQTVVRVLKVALKNLMKLTYPL